MATMLPPNWTRYTNDEGKEYFHNEVTDVTQWRAPEWPGSGGERLRDDDALYTYTPDATASADGRLPATSAVPLIGASVSLADASAAGSSQAKPSCIRPPAPSHSERLAGAQPATSGRNSGAGVAAVFFEAVRDAANSSRDIGDGEGERAVGQTPSAASRLVEKARTLFDISEVEVRQRLVLSLLPFGAPRAGEEEFRPRPDFWGPLWVATTAVFMMAATGNLGRHFTEALKANQTSVADEAFEPNYRLLSTASLIVYGLLFIVPLVVRALLFFLAQEPHCLDITRLICVYGYALTPVLPLSVLCVTPNGFIRTVAATACLFVAVAFIRRSLQRDLATESRYLRNIVIAVPCAGQVVTFASYRLHFFARWNKWV